jgi:hypothetical protein
MRLNLHFPVLAPIAEILSPFKKQKNGNSALYELQFLNLMRTRHIEERLSPEMLDGVCLLCTEERPHNYDRRLFAEYLNSKCGSVTIEHVH